MLRISKAWNARSELGVEWGLNCVGSSSGKHQQSQTTAVIPRVYESPAEINGTTNLLKITHVLTSLPESRLHGGE